MEENATNNKMVTSPGVGWNADSATGGVPALTEVMPAAGGAPGVTEVLAAGGCGDA